MKKIADVINEVDELKPNALSTKVKIEWINELEASIQAEIWQTAVKDIRRHESADESVFVDDAHTRLYREYLCAMVDYANGEYDKYDNTMALFNACYVEYSKWYIRKFGNPQTSEGVYITAYGLAVKHGYAGTEEEWLLSLKGDAGAKGEKGEKGDKGDPGVPGTIIISSVEQTVTSTEDNGVNELTVTLSDGTLSTFEVRNGSKGSQGLKGDKGDKGDNGVGIEEIEQTIVAEKSGEENEITVYLTNGSFFNFVVRNGEKGDTGLQGPKGDAGADLTEKTIENYEGLLTSNSVYSAVTGNSLEFPIPSGIVEGVQNQILIYLQTTATADIRWAEGFLFVGGEIPTIGVGHYRIIIEYNPNAEAWVVGVVQDGAVS